MTIKVAVVGCGSISRERHVPEFAANPNAKIVALCDLVKERAEKLAEPYGAKVFTDYKEMLKMKDIDVVSVCTPNYLHAQVTIDSFKAGKHVLCEKPMCTTVEEGEAMIKAAKKAGKILMIAQNQRYMPAHVKAKEILDSGKLGKVYSFRTIFGHGGPESWSVEKKNTWFFRKNEAIFGAMGDLGVHKIDLIRHLLDEKFIYASAFIDRLEKKYPDGKPIDVDDNAVCILRGKSGVMGEVIASWTYKIGDNSTEIYCEKGVLKLYKGQFPLSVEYNYHEKENFTFADKKSGVMDAFIDCIVNNKTPLITGEEGLKTMKIVFACVESSKKKTMVEIK